MATGNSRDRRPPTGDVSDEPQGLKTEDAMARIQAAVPEFRDTQFRYLIKIGALEEAGSTRAKGGKQSRRHIRWSEASVERAARAAAKFEELGSWAEALRQIDVEDAAKEPRRAWDEPAEIIAIAMRKGGVGKTTIAYNLAGALAMRELPADEEMQRRPVLLVDLDPQATLTRKFFEGYDASELPVTTAELFGDDPEGAAQNAVQRTWLANLDIIPMRPQSRRVFADSDPQRLAQFAASLVKRNVPVEHWAGEIEQHTAREIGKLKIALDTLRRQYGHIVLDCANNVTFVIQAGLLAADHVVIPTGYDVESLDGYLDICEDLTWLAHAVGHAPNVLGLLGNILFPRDSVGAWVIDRHYLPAAKARGHRFFDTELRRASSIKEAMTALRPLAYQTRNSEGKKMFASAAAELLARIAKFRGGSVASHSAEKRPRQTARNRG